jgi:hypothetical protein
MVEFIAKRKLKIKAIPQRVTKKAQNSQRKKSNL